MQSFTGNIRTTIKTKESWGRNVLSGMLDTFDKELINTLTSKGLISLVRTHKFLKPQRIIRGDVTTVMVGGIGHPGIVWKRKKDTYFCICMSSTVASHNIHEIKDSRLYTGYVTKTIVELTEKEVLGGFIGSFDNRTELKLIFLLVKDYYTNLIK